MPPCNNKTEFNKKKIDSDLGSYTFYHLNNKIKYEQDYFLRMKIVLLGTMVLRNFML